MTNQSKQLFPCGNILQPPTTRRDLLRSFGCGFGMLAFSAMCQDEASASPSSLPSLTPLPGHLPQRAKRVIFVFLQGGPSQIDLFQNKPALTRLHGQKPPSNIAHSNEFTTEGFESTKLLKPIAKFHRFGKSGTWVSELLPHLSQQVDQLCILNGMEADNPAHSPAIRQLFTGTPFAVHPSLGSWVSYGLGSENYNLPSFVFIGNGTTYRSGCLPAIHQGMVLEGDKEFNIRHLKNDLLSRQQQAKQSQLLKSLNHRHLSQAIADPAIEGLIAAYELAFRMQSHTGGVVDISQETAETHQLYGIGEGRSTDFTGRKLLVARRLAEAGVRFVQVNLGGWDHHISLATQLPTLCDSNDQPIAGLLQDLDRRGLLDDTLVVCTGEFGRTPFDQDVSRGKNPPETYGRGHSPQGFTALLAGGGTKRGIVHGETDEIGYRVVDGKVHIHDLQATILYLLGLDHERLTYRHAGRDIRLTDVYGRIVKEVLA